MIPAIVGENIQRVGGVGGQDTSNMLDRATQVADIKSINAFENHMSAPQKINPLAEVSNPQGVDNDCAQSKAHDCVLPQNNGIAEVKNATLDKPPCIDGIDSTKDCYGTKILEGLEKIRDTSAAEIDSIMLALQKPDITSGELMGMQYQMNIWALKQDLFAKSAGGFDRSVDTLLKAQ